MQRIIIASLIMLVAGQGFSQGVRFFSGDYQEALEKAEEENKLIFVDAYTTWCGPCKQMDRHVFPDNELGDLFNEEFINLKMDMESDRGRAFGQIHPVGAYPTLMFLDIKGEMMTQVRGFQSVQELIDLAKKTLVDKVIDKGNSSYEKLQAVDQFRLMSQVHQGLNQDDFFWYYRSSMLLGPDNEMVLKNMTEAKTGWTHYRYEQQYKGVPVQGVSYQLHKYNDDVRSANGSFLPEIDVDIEPAMNSEEILKIAMQDMGAEKYNWQDHGHGSFCTHGSPEPSLCIIDRAYPKYSGNYALAYELDLVSEQPLAGNTYFIDAHTGEVLYKVNLHQHQGVPGRGVTKYYGEQDIIVDSLGAEDFMLRDPTRGIDGINIWNSLEGVTFSSNSSYFDLTNEDQNEVAVDALYCTSRFYDLCRDELDWLGLDNNDASFNVVVHAGGGVDFINAFWNGDFASFGNGDCNNGPLVTFEVLAHEFQHGITDYTSDLIYAEESGAINESMSDVIGKYAEWYFDRANFSWQLGPSFQYLEDAEPFRDLEDPESVGNPSYYKGETWEDGSGVHTNSAIGNLFYFMLSDGKSGVNEDMETYSVEGIGIEQAAKFIFHVNRNYLSENSGYNDYYEACLIAAPEFFNGDQAQIDNIVEAWKAVGLPNGSTTGSILDLGISVSGNLRACGYGNYQPLTFTVANEGTIDYTENMGASVLIEYGGFNATNSRTIEIDTNLLTGESYEVTVDSFLLLDDNFISVSYELMFVVDGNFENDLADQFVSVTEYEEDDLSVTAQLSDMSCDNDSIILRYAIVNSSCNPIAENTEIDLFVRDFQGSTLWSTSFITTDLLAPRATLVYDTIIELDLRSYSSVFMEVESKKDPFEFNNVEEVEFKILDWVGKDYSNDFEDRGFEEGISVETINGDNRRYQNGSNRFYTTGFFDEPFDPLCFDPDRNWDKEIGFFSPITATLDMCADLMDEEKTTMVFDVIQFRNEVPGFTTIESSSMRVNWDSPQGSGYEIIQGLSEGEIEEIKIPLPENFRGTINMQFLTHAGTSEFDSEFLQYDLQFLDNLRFLPATVSVEDKTLQNAVKLYPNPASDELFVDTDLQIVSYDIIDIAGKRISASNSFNDSKVSVSHLQDGMYFMILKTTENETIEKRFVKTE